MERTGYVFAYGSLLGREEGVRAELDGHVRAWSVAMDNRQSLPGYKCYTLDGTRPACHVAFLTVVPEPGTAVNGVAFPVTAAALEALDRRERNYDRVDVTDRVSPRLPGQVFTYAASAAGRQRYEQASIAGTGAVCRAYLDAVVEAFAALGGDELARYLASTRPPTFPVLDLVRHDLPG